MHSLDDSIKQYYQKHSLDQHKIQKIKNANDNNITLEHAYLAHKHYQQPRWVNRICITLIVLASLFSFTIFELQMRNQSHVLANEISFNHHNAYSNEFKSLGFNELKDEFKETHFPLQVPTHIQNKFNLLGARYCSLSNKLAVHLQLANKETGQTHSLFITSLSYALKNIQKHKKIAKLHQSKYWSKQDLFYAMVNTH